MKPILPALLCLLSLAAPLLGEEMKIDWDKAKALHERVERGDTLSPEDQTYYAEAKKQFEAGHGPGGQDSRDNKDGIDMARARDIYKRVEKGETVSDEDKKYLEEAKKRRQSRGGNPNSDGFNWERAKSIYAKVQAGEKVSDEDMKFLEEAKRRRDQNSGGGGNGENRKRPEGANAFAPSEAAKGLVPLTELKGKYKIWDGGLYGGGSNDVPAAQQKLASKALADIQPLDAEGKPAADGKIVLMSIGMSNTTMEFSQFVKMANADDRKAANVVVVDAAPGGKAAKQWAAADAPPWNVAAERLQNAGVTPKQVQVLWIKQANIAPSAGSEAEVKRLQDDMQAIVTLAKEKYPNARLAFLSSRIYAGYAQTQLNPEPYAYEGAFAMRGLIAKQTGGDQALAADKSPVLLWGPYLWGAGATPRQGDGLVWKPEDLGGDGTHPSPSGAQKVAKLLLDFFTSDANARGWFLKR